MTKAVEALVPPLAVMVGLTVLALVLVLVPVTSPLRALPPLPPWALEVPPVPLPPLAVTSPVVWAAARVGLAVMVMLGVEPEPPPEPLEAWRWR